MCEIMNYIFRSLHNSDRRLDVISRAIRKQQKFNNCVAVFLLVRLKDRNRQQKLKSLKAKSKN